MNARQQHRQHHDPQDTKGVPAPGPAARARPLVALLAVALAIVVSFHAALVAGVPWGAAAYGGFQSGQLPSDLRVASAVQAAFWLLATLTVLSRGGITSRPVLYAFSRRAVWALAALLALGSVMNAASSSNWERFGWAPFVLALSLLSLKLARTPERSGTP